MSIRTATSKRSFVGILVVVRDAAVVLVLVMSALCSGRAVVVVVVAVFAVFSLESVNSYLTLMLCPFDGIKERECRYDLGTTPVFVC